MGGPGIFVSYYAANRMHPDYAFAAQCMRDLRAWGAEVVIESALVPRGVTEAQFSGCQWLMLILTPDALQSRQVQLEVETALRLVAQQRLRGVLALTPVECAPETLPTAWAAVRIFDASEDYARAMAAIGLTLNLVRLQALSPKVLPQPVKRSFVEMMRLPLERHRKSSAMRTLPVLSTVRSGRGLLAAFALVLIFLVIFSSVVIVRGQSAGAGSHAGTSTPTPTVLPSNPAQLFAYVTRQPPILSDPLSKQDANHWDETGGCAFQNGVYDVSIQVNGNYTDCLEHFRSFSNFAYQVQMQIVSGDAGGLLFRANDSLTDFYRFSLDALHQNYNLLVCKACKMKTDETRIVSNPSTLSIQLHHTYTLTIIAYKNLIYLFVNEQLFDIKPDASLQSGMLGLYVYAYSNATEVEFSNMKVWEIK